MAAVNAAGICLLATVSHTLHHALIVLVRPIVAAHSQQAEGSWLTARAGFQVLHQTCAGQSANDFTQHATSSSKLVAHFVAQAGNFTVSGQNQAMATNATDSGITFLLRQNWDLQGPAGDALRMLDYSTNESQACSSISTNDTQHVQQCAQQPRNGGACCFDTNSPNVRFQVSVSCYVSALCV